MPASLARGSDGRPRPWRPPRGMGQLAERVGFEPTVLSHTAFRERHLQPLGHLSAAESSKGTPSRPSGRRGPAGRRLSGRRRGSARSGRSSAAASWRMPDTTPSRCGQPRRVGQPDGRAAGALARVAPARTRAVRRRPGAGRPCTSHTAPPRRRRSCPGSQRRPRRRAASRSRAMTACAVGSPLAAHRLRGRAPPSPRRARRQRRQHARRSPAASAASARAARMKSS